MYCDGKDDKCSLIHRSISSDNLRKRSKSLENGYHLCFTAESREMKGRYLTHRYILHITGDDLAQSVFEVLA